MTNKQIRYKTETNKQNKDVIFRSTIIGSILMIPFLNKVISTITSISNPGNILGVLTLTLLVMQKIIFSKNKINIRKVGFLIYLLLFFMLSLIYLEYDSIVIEYLVNFLYFGMVPVLLTDGKVSAYIVTKSMIIISLVGLLNVNTIIDSSIAYAGTTVINMGFSYAILPSIVAAIIYFIYYRSKNNLFIFLGYAFNFYLLLKVVTSGTRGVSVAIFYIMVILITNQYRRSENGINHKTYTRLLWVSTISLVIVGMNFSSIIEFIYKETQALGINLNFINKTYYQMLQQNVWNGRLTLYANAIDGIIKSPIWGNGIGNFYIMNNIYPHNIILQLMHEGGILLTFPILYILAYGFIKFFQTREKDMDFGLMFALLSSISIPRLFFSAVVWNSSSFWLIIGLVLEKYFYKKY